MLSRIFSATEGPFDDDFINNLLYRLTQYPVYVDLGI